MLWRGVNLSATTETDAGACPRLATARPQDLASGGWRWRPAFPFCVAERPRSVILAATPEQGGRLPEFSFQNSGKIE